jgi:hypothetical protein
MIFNLIKNRACSVEYKILQFKVLFYDFIPTFPTGMALQ